MESDSDLDSDLPPGWELSTLNDKPYYINHINNTGHIEHPLKKSERFRKTHLKESFIQKFDAFSTSEKVMKNKDCSNDVAIILGGCSGIGLEIVHQLTSKGCHLILGCPEVQRCTWDILAQIDEDTLRSQITILPLDLSSLRSVKNFNESVMERCTKVTMIVVSAAVMNPPYKVTEDGFESSFQINCLSPLFLVVTLLQPFCVEDRVCKVLFMACESHHLVKTFDLEDLRPSSDDYDGYYSYGLCNLLKIIMARELPKRLDQCGIKGKLSVFAVHPGNVVNNTGITRYSPMLSTVFWVCGPFTKTLSQAAASPLYCITSGSLAKYSGSYINNGCLCEPSTLARDPKVAHLIWDHLWGLIEAL